MRTAIRKHLGDFLAIIGLFVLSLAVAAYILSNERLRFPLVEKPVHRLKVVLPDAQAVTPGQGQTVRVAGVEVGQIGKIELEDGRAIVELQVEPKYKRLIRSDATALLRAKTGVKDMFLEVDPGDGRPLREGELIRVENTAPDIDPDEVLSALDADTRDYLRLLISGAGKGLKGRGSDLREAMARLGPLHRDLRRVNSAIARRRANLRRLVHNYGLLTQHLGRADRDIVRLVRASNSVFEAFASQEQNISLAVARLPGALRTTQGALARVDRMSDLLGPTLEDLRPAFRRLDQANREVLPLVREGAPIIRNQLRPFARIAAPYTRDLGIAARGLARAGPDLRRTFLGLNRLFNIGAYNPGGREGISDACEQNGVCSRAERDRNEGYLYWLAWVGTNTVSLFNTSDAQGVMRRISLGGVNCAVLEEEATTAGTPAAEAALVAGLFGALGVCAS